MEHLPKVSLIMPCYNSAPYIDVMLASVYNQNYDNIELICVNGSSTDNTSKKITSWKSLFIKRGYSLTLLERPGTSLTEAINEGLCVFTGEYVCFPDSDDMLDKEYVSAMADYLTGHADKDWVRCNFLRVRTSTYDHHICSDRDPQHGQEKGLLERLITEKSTRVVWALMVRRSCLSKILPEMKLGVSQGWESQEYQLLLPLAFYGRMGYIDRPLYTYLVRDEGSFLVSIRTSFETATSFQRALFESIQTTLALLPLEPEQSHRLHLLNELMQMRHFIQSAKTFLKLDVVQAQSDYFIALCTREFPAVLKKLTIETITQNPLPCINGVIDWLMLAPEEKEALQFSAFENLGNRRIAIYGAGDRGQTLVSRLLEIGIMPELIWDRAAGEDGMKSHIWNVPVVPPDFSLLSPANKSEMTVIVSILRDDIYIEVRKLLLKNGFSNTNITRFLPLSKRIAYMLEQSVNERVQ